MLWWRRYRPASFARWRQLPAALLRVGVAVGPTGWKITRQSLQEPYYGSSWVQNAAAYIWIVTFCSAGATGTVLVSPRKRRSAWLEMLWHGAACFLNCIGLPGLPMHALASTPVVCSATHAAVQALARPLCLWLHVPTQAAFVLLVGSHNAALCSTPALQHPVAQQAAAHVYAALSGLLGLLPLPVAALAGLPPWHSPLGQCRAVLAMANVVLGVVAPTLVLAAAESRMFLQHRRHWKRWQQQEASQQRQQLPDSAAAAAPAAGTGGGSQRGRAQGLVGSGDGGGGGEPGAISRLLPDAAMQQQLLQQRQRRQPAPPGRLAVSGYSCLHACLHPQDAADWITTLLLATMLFCAAWQAVLLLTPP
jgi:hypothetical protein